MGVLPSIGMLNVRNVVNNIVIRVNNKAYMYGWFD